jgi:hypothetical protein
VPFLGHVIALLPTRTPHPPLNGGAKAIVIIGSDDDRCNDNVSRAATQAVNTANVKRIIDDQVV